MKTCGCAATPRRQCDLCGPSSEVFVACSRKCLDKHKQSQHAGSAESDMRHLMSQANRKRDRNWELYEDHRKKLSTLAQSVRQGRGLCVLGAGNCDDLDLPALIDTFGNVHLVDIDGAAMNRGIARLPEGAHREKVVPHAGVDLAGYLDEVDTWERAVPPLDELLLRAESKADEMISEIGGGPFDVVLSSCILSQLWVPLKRTLVLRAAEWNRVFALMSLTHLFTMIKLTRPGGTCVLVTEVAASPIQEPNLDLLLTLLGDHPDLRRMIENPRLVEPWLWTLDGRTVVVHGLLFQCVQGTGFKSTSPYSAP
jgi:hypothetical protein